MTISSHVVASRPAVSAGHSHPYLLSLIDAGTAHILQDGRETFVGVGDIVLADRTRPLRVEATTLKVKSIDIPEVRMREVLPQVDGMTAVRIPGQTPAGAIIKATVDEIFRLCADAHERVVDHLADTIPHLLAAAFAELPMAQQAVPRRSEAYQRQRILQFVHLRLGDKNLSPQMIAQALDLSPRYIHSLFAGEPMTLMHRVWNERLERCRNELATASLAHCRISEIAYRWGFSYPAHFSRAFSARFGESPTAFRRKATTTARQS